jgi:hypothetical protein
MNARRLPNTLGNFSEHFIVLCSRLLKKEWVCNKPWVKATNGLNLQHQPKIQYDTSQGLSLCWSSEFERIQQVLMKVIPGMTVDITMNVMQEPHVKGPPVVIICPQSYVGEHCLRLQRISLLSSIKPTTGGGWSRFLTVCVSFSECEVYVQMG